MIRSIAADLKTTWRYLRNEFTTDLARAVELDRRISEQQARCSKGRECPGWMAGGCRLAATDLDCLERIEIDAEGES